MNYTEIEWNGFSGFEFEFMGLPARVIKPNGKPNGMFALKTEYWNAFPATEIELLNRGWHVAFNQNYNRMAEPEDLRRKGEFIKFVAKEFGLDDRCVPVGMSCGGMYAVKLAALYPENIRAMFLDAPVMNLLSWPLALGNGGNAREEYYRCTGRTVADMLSYRDHPIDNMHKLVENNIPILLVSGDSDEAVPYEENGALLEKYYKENGGKIVCYIMKGRKHHPHGLENPAVAVDEIEKLCR